MGRTIRWAGAALALGMVGCGAEGGAGPSGLTLRGRAHVAGGEAEFGGLHAVWIDRGTGRRDSAAVAGDGAFTIHVGGDGGPGELRVDGPAPRTVHPFLLPFPSPPAEALDLVLVPRRWTIRRGLHAGVVVPVPLDPVVDDTETFLYSYWFGQALPLGAPTRYQLDLTAWPDEALPVAAAFDHRHGDPSFTPADSAALWAVLDRLETVYGVDWFEPVEADPTWWPDDAGPLEPHPVPGVVRLVWLPGRWAGPAFPRADPPTWREDLGTWAAGGRFDTFEMRRLWTEAGKVLISGLEPLRLADGWIPWETVFMHEVMHVLGAGHTCRLPSPMGPCMRTAEPSTHDVAYLELLRAVMTLEDELDTVYGVMPAILGERRILLETSPLPGMDRPGLTPLPGPAPSAR